MIPVSSVMPDELAMGEIPCPSPAEQGGKNAGAAATGSEAASHRDWSRKMLRMAPESSTEKYHNDSFFGFLTRPFDGHATVPDSLRGEAFRNGRRSFPGKSGWHMAIRRCIMWYDST